MIIELANENDYFEVAQMRWVHAVEDDKVYREKNTNNVDKDKYINKVIEFLKEKKEYKIFVAKENGNILASMFIYLVPKIPTPNGNQNMLHI